MVLIHFYLEHPLKIRVHCMYNFFSYICVLRIECLQDDLRRVWYGLA